MVEMQVRDRALGFELLSFELAGTSIAVARDHRAFQRELKLQAVSV
jgi:hypothetical protein